MQQIIHVFLVGSKGLPARYGGFETFVHNLTAGKRCDQIQYHVSCMAATAKQQPRFLYNGADCFFVGLPLPGAPGRILHVGLVLHRVEGWMKQHPGETVIVYILGCRVGPLLIPHAKALHRLGAVICCNPDGLEWKRRKWSPLARRFLHYCEKCLVENSDLAICDSRNIESYLCAAYGSRVRVTTYIAYGAKIERSTCSKEQLQQWYRPFGLKAKDYYLIVGRFVPENNFETILREYMRSTTTHKLVIITNVAHDRFYAQLDARTGFSADSRICFVGTVYDSALLKKIRENACGYLHGHEAGGTNPSLLEGLASTPLNLLLDVGFNREVAQDAALYWTKETGSLAALLAQADALSPARRTACHAAGIRRVRAQYSWPDICERYEGLWLRLGAAKADPPAQRDPD